MANLGTAKECRKKTFKFLIARQMCYITNKIEHNGCGKIISGWDNFKTIAISIEWARISCVPTILFSLFSLCFLQQYVRITCVCMTMNGDANQPTNQRHLYPKLSGKANEIGREQRKKKPCDSKIIIVTVSICWFVYLFAFTWSATEGWYRPFQSILMAFLFPLKYGTLFLVICIDFLLFVFCFDYLWIT